jgi:hypothetical protein
MLAENGNPKEGYIFTSQTKDTQGKPLDTRRINEAIKTLAQKTFGKDKAKEFKTKALRSFYNSALLRAKIQPQELKDVMMGHKRLGARGHYAYDEFTIKDAYAKAFEHLSINGIQSREDLAQMRNKLAQLEHKREEDKETLLKALKDLQNNYEELRDTWMDQVKGSLILDEMLKNAKTDKEKAEIVDKYLLIKKGGTEEKNEKN